ncbi:Beta-lactamase domain protein [Candidatus Zixiibacteriota bacterium]|nr:Beta-lactamase domain protein [candidate division Zixibacteria bacterium]
MFKTTRLYLFLIIVLLLFVACSGEHGFKVAHQLAGTGETNCYLLYDLNSREAALFDVGGPIDSLTDIIASENLKLKYLFVTHAHCDHVAGMPAVMNAYPEVQFAIAREEFDDMTRLYMEWERAFDSAALAQIKSDPALLALMDFDFGRLGEPDIYLADNQTYWLGEQEIKTVMAPGHSRGSICFYLDSTLFSGDVLFYRTVGRTDLPESGGKEALTKSVRRLYDLLSDKTVVYPGHGQPTDIGSEKRENKKITADAVLM